MTKTIEELASEYVKDVYSGDTDFIDEAENVLSWLFAKPLASRLTAEEKERVRRIYMEYKWLYAKHKDSVFRWAEVYKGQYELLESIFGADFFKEGE